MKNISQAFSNRLIIAAFVVIAVLVAVVILRFSLTRSPELPESDDIKIRGNDEEIVVRENGHVSYRSGNELFNGYWSKDKLNAFLQYLKDSAQAGKTGSISEFEVLWNNGTYYLSIDDELIQTIISELQDTTENPGQGDGNLDDFFNSPTPKANQIPSTPPALPAPTSGDDQPVWCKVWKLSYCADIIPGPSSSPTATPAASEAPYVFDCEGLQGLVTDRTVVSNSLCIKEEVGP